VRKAIAVALALLSLAPVRPFAQQSPRAFPAPRSVLGFEPCADYTLATSEQTAAYFRALAAASRGRMQLVEIGKTTEGRPELMAIISSDANIRGLAKYKNISRQLALARGPSDEARAPATARRSSGSISAFTRRKLRRRKPPPSSPSRPSPPSPPRCARFATTSSCCSSPT
jgi:hypothetical protein